MNSKVHNPAHSANEKRSKWFSAVLQSFLKGLARLYPAAKRGLYRFHGGIFPQYNKSLSAKQPIHAPIIPERLILPLQQQVGQPAELLVKVGSYVKKNQLIARSNKDATKALVVPIHAPTSGTIIAVEPFTLPHPSGLTDLCVILKPDQLDVAINNVLHVDASVPKTPQALKDILFNAGIIGMGGAGFPTYAKIPAQKGQIHTLMINGAECEPFITCDDLLMQTRSDEIIQGAIMTAHALGAVTILFGIETNKPEAIKAAQIAANNAAQKFTDDPIVQIISVATVYPMGGQKQLTQELTGVEVPKKTHSVDLGMLMMNVATFAAIYRAVTYGEPLTSRLITVSGLGLHKPFNIQALIGTPFDVLAQAAQPKTPLNYPLIVGGPMMGYQVKNNQVPVTKTSNCILANPPQPIEMQMPCIRCGECMDACPINLLPQQMYWHAQAHEYDKVEKLNVFDCIECGCCSFVCPSHIPLVQYYRHAKAEIKELHVQAHAIDLAKQRHEFKLARIEREKQEREARLNAKKAAVKQAIKPPAQEITSTQDTTMQVAPKPVSAAAAAAKAAAAKRAAQKSAAKMDEIDAVAVTFNHPSIDPSNHNQALPNVERHVENHVEPHIAPSNPPSLEPTVLDLSAMPPARRRAIEAAQKAALKSAHKSVQKADTPDNYASQPQIIDLTQASVSSNTTNSSSAALDKENARNAAMQAARDAAQKRKASVSAAKPPIQTQAPTDLSSNDLNAIDSVADASTIASKIEPTLAPTDSPESKRDKAVAAARLRAAQRKTQSQEPH
ncbi:electron transport complex subunit RsxC [Thiomicrorhabdus aquaedulcis]|uniref:electron transport complex subunit RsxC n=1 Tax=Thiomicrorhabdus aquaedulcis TaxID=2211106 RepID=UPI000FD7C2D2|nr:electron transport complex subunit RsxC [Thiomicrorhabdus aquaedulcis]